MSAAMNVPEKTADLSDLAQRWASARVYSPSPKTDVEDPSLVPPDSEVQAIEVDGRRIVSAGALEVTVWINDGAAVLTWNMEPMVAAVWNGRCLVDFLALRQGRAPGASGALVRAAIEAVEKALRRPAQRRDDLGVTWSVLDEIAARLRGAVAADPLAPLVAALGALGSPTPIASVLEALEQPAQGFHPFVAAVATAIASDLEAAVAMPWLRLMTAPQLPSPPPSPKAKESKRPMKKKPRPRYPETVY